MLEISLEAQLDVVGGRMEPVGVGRFNNEDVRARRVLVVAEYRLVRLAEVPRKQQPVVVTVVGADIELDQRGAEDMPGVEELERHPSAYLARLVHVGRHEQLHQRVDVAFFVKRLEQLLAFPAAPLVDVFEIALLEKARVAQHYVAQIGRGLPCEHPSAEPLPDELGEVPAMVYVRMGENYVVDLGRIDREVPVLLERLFAMSLVQPAIEQYPLSVRLDQMHGPGRRLCRSVEGYSHALIIPKFRPLFQCGIAASGIEEERKVRAGDGVVESVVPCPPVDLRNLPEHLAEVTEPVRGQPWIAGLRELHRVDPRAPLRERGGAREDGPLARYVVRDEPCAHELRRPRLERALQGAERVRLVRALRRTLDVEEPLARLDDLPVLDARVPELPRLVVAPEVIARRFEVYREEVHGSITTFVPLRHIAYSRAAFQFARRKHPCEPVKPMDSGRGVPWIP